MGIVNVTPDSFSDGGAFADAEKAAEHALALAAAGAAIVDIGAESTRPGFTPVPAAEECARLLPVLEAIAGRLTVPISVDTTKASVARRALAAGAGIVNDIWGLQADPAMADTVAEAGAAVVIMHNRSAAEEGLDVEGDLRRFFDESLARAARAGIATARIALDPGVGFGKTAAQQVDAVRAIPALLRAYGLPILVGASRKSMLRFLTGSTLDQRLPDTIAAHLAAFTLGASIFRTHDVAAQVAAFKVFRALAETRAS